MRDKFTFENNVNKWRARLIPPVERKHFTRVLTFWRGFNILAGDSRFGWKWLEEGGVGGYNAEKQSAQVSEGRKNGGSPCLQTFVYCARCQAWDADGMLNDLRVHYSVGQESVKLGSYRPQPSASA